MKHEIHHIVICTNLVRLYHERLFELCMKVRVSAISLLNRRTSVTLGFRNLRNRVKTSFFTSAYNIIFKFSHFDTVWAIFRKRKM